jgi:hypothetical protein
MLFWVVVVFGVGARGEPVSPQSEPPQPGQVMEKTYQACQSQLAEANTKHDII